MKQQNTLEVLWTHQARQNIEHHINVLASLHQNNNALRIFLLVMQGLTNETITQGLATERVHERLHDLYTITTIALVADARLQNQFASNYLRDHQDLVRLYAPQHLEPTNLFSAFLSYVVTSLTILSCSSFNGVGSAVIPMSGESDLSFRTESYRDHYNHDYNDDHEIS